MENKVPDPTFEEPIKEHVDMTTQERHQEAADQPFDDLSSKPENSLTDKMTKENQEEVPDSAEGNDLLSKLGLSKKERLKKENTELKHKADELNDKFLRLYAEFDNYKKRTLKERIEISRNAGIEIINALIPVIDDFSRALKQMENSNDLAGLQEGVKLIHQKMNAVLESRGLKQMKSLHEPFNPELHDAIAEVPAQDPSLAGKVVDEIECGYYLNDKIIRHAKVVVGK